jgi:hypothetical protein
MSTRFRSIKQANNTDTLADIKEQVNHFYCKREAYTVYGELKKDLGVAQALALIDDEYKEEWLNEFDNLVGFKCWDLHLNINYSSTLSTYYGNLKHLIVAHIVQIRDNEYWIEKFREDVDA